MDKQIAVDKVSDGESLNGIDPEVDAAWGVVASRRTRELRSGKVRGVPVSAVFSRARNFLRSK